MGKKSAEKRERREQGDSAVAVEDAPAAAPTAPIQVSDASFDREVVESDVPVLVDFWAPWCGPCKAIAPVLEELAKTYAGRFKVVKYNTQAYQRVATAMGIRSIPTLVLFKDGQVADVKVGAGSREALESWILRAIEPKRSILARIFG